jgi:hypothetical protein
MVGKATYLIITGSKSVLQQTRERQAFCCLGQKMMIFVSCKSLSNMPQICQFGGIRAVVGKAKPGTQFECRDFGGFSTGQSWDKHERSP